jgi:site-specific DNA-methyltransferase (adenine-specific)
MNKPQPFFRGRGITLYCGDVLRVAGELGGLPVDAVITDPPYSSGGFTRGDRMGDPVKKYKHSGTKARRSTFSGDNRDARSWARWCNLWLSDCRGLTADRGYILMFSDWRQLPTASDAIQGGGWLWRGLVSWDKTGAARAPHKGYFRHQCEYVLWGTNGRCKIATHGGPWPGSFTIPVLQSDKHHLTGKPTRLMEQLVQCVPEGATVLDPFAGSGTTLVAAVKQKRRGVGIELDRRNCEIAARRILAA